MQIYNKQSFFDMAGGSRGIRPQRVEPGIYSSYKSPFAPKYNIPLNVHGFDSQFVRRSAKLGAGFVGALGITAVFFFAEIPRMSQDVMQKIPILGDYFVKEIPPEDNPF